MRLKGFTVLRLKGLVTIYYNAFQMVGYNECVYNACQRLGLTSECVSGNHFLLLGLASDQGCVRGKYRPKTGGVCFFLLNFLIVLNSFQVALGRVLR